MTDQARQVRDALQNALADALNDVDDLLVRWVAVVEVVGPEGKRACWTLCAPGSMPWDLLALHEYALAVERAAIARDE